MKDFTDYITRWLSTNTPNLTKNIVMTGGIVTITCIAVREGVYEYFGNTKTCLFSVLMCCIWSGLFNSIALFFSEREYTPDDLDKFLSVRTYVAANCMIQMALCAVEAIESAAIFSGFFRHTDGGLLFGSRTLDYTLAFFLITFSADMLGFLIGILISSITSIMTVIPIVLIAQLLLSGCLFELDGFLAKIAEFTTAHWGFYALGSIADLNSLPPFNIPQSVFPRNREYVAACFSQLVLLTLICIFFSGVLLYLKTNLKEE